MMKIIKQFPVIRIAEGILPGGVQLQVIKQEPAEEAVFGMGNESSDNVAVNKTGAKLVSLGGKNRLWLAGGCMDNSWNRGVGLGLDFINGNFYGKLLSLLIEKHFLCLP